LKEKGRTHNSRLARLRILWSIHVCVPQEILSLVENKRLRSSQPRQAAERCAIFLKTSVKTTLLIKKQNLNDK
jgi:hypothetical protein